MKKFPDSGLGGVPEAALLPRRDPTITIKTGPGLNVYDEDVCLCGHVSSLHRSNGKNTCEGFRCGCYTFRPIENPDPASQGPKCSVCDKVFMARRVFRIPGGGYTVQWWHTVARFCQTQGIEYDPMKELRQAIDDPEFFNPPEPEAPWVTVCCTHNMGQHDPDTLGCNLCPCRALRRERGGVKPTTDPRAFPTIDEWQMELSQVQAERNKPQRAPREWGDV